MKTRPAGAPAMPGSRYRRGQGIDEVSRVAISTRIWVAFGVLILLLAFTGAGMILARNDLEGVRSSLHRAELKLKETELRLKNALDDKQQVFKELAAQGNRLAEFSRSEEKARSALASVSTGTEATKKRLADLKARLAKSQTRLRALRKANAALSTFKAEAVLLTSELDETRAKLEQTQAEMERFRALAEPYSTDARRP